MRTTRASWRFAVLVAALVAMWAAAPASGPENFRFVILGDRTGSAQPGVYEQAWREAVAGHPAFVIASGDTIEGLDDSTALAEWREVAAILKPYRRYPFYSAPGNHDVWSEASENLFRRHTGHPAHYSFDHGQAHFVVLDNSRTEELSKAELEFLKDDLRAHASQPLKFIFSHRPSWLLDVVLGNPRFPLHRLAREYGVKYVIAGHVHQMLHADLEDVTYISLPSSGGHLRNSRKYEDGWFFAYTVVDVRGNEAHLQIRELGPPHGLGRVTEPKDWGTGRLMAQARSASRR